MARTLRRENMEDMGNATLKYKVLDFLTNLRLEAKLLNEGKT